ncbi:MAG: hypothetical protein GYA66_15560 [Phyllobacteriaceae bacterium]|nr:hypothetical protein [Phyllobacteriaceae bacterium]
MTLQQIAQILGGIGVIASMVYVGIQIRNNARAVRAASYQQLSASVTASWDNLFNNAESCALALRGGDNFESLDRLEKARFRFMHMSSMRRYENAWVQHRIGTLKEDDWRAIAVNIDSLFTLPGTHAAWKLVKNRSNPAFRAYIDEIANRLAPLAAAHVPPAPVPAITKPRRPKA